MHTRSERHKLDFSGFYESRAVSGSDVPRLALLVGALVLLRAGSCLRVERPYPTPTAEAVLASIQSRTLGISSLRGEARMSHRGSRQQVKATVRLMAARPGKFRFDLVSPFDTPLATLVCRDGKFALIDAQANRHYHGPASPCNLARLLPVALPPDQILALLTGGTPLVAHRRRALRWDERTGVEELLLSGADATQVLRLEGRDRRWDLLGSEIRDRQGRVVLRIRANHYRKVGGHSVPERILLEQPLRGSSMELIFKSEEVNVALPSAAFDLPPPAGLPSQYVDCS